MQIDTSSANQVINPDLQRQQFAEIAQEFLNNSEINKRIRGIIGRNNRFNINIDELRQFNPLLANHVIKNPIEAIKIFEDQLNNTIRGLQEDGGKMGSEKMANAADAYFPKKVQTYYINFEGSFGKNFVTPRGLKANLVN